MSKKEDWESSRSGEVRGPLSPRHPYPRVFLFSTSLRVRPNRPTQTDTDRGWGCDSPTVGWWTGTGISLVHIGVEVSGLHE